MTKKKTTRILCKKSGTFHTITFNADGTVVSSGCGDVTEQASAIGTVVALGKPLMADHCAGIAALVIFGVPSFFRQPGDPRIILGGWQDLYTRFESIKAVQGAMTRERSLGRKRAKAASAPSAVQESFEEGQ